MLILRQIVKFLELLHSETSRAELAAGFVLGMFLGFTPTLTLHWFCLWVVLFFFRINIGAALLSYAAFKILSFGLDPLFHKIGIMGLGLDGLRGLWTAFYNVPVIPFTRFNNSVVFGSLVTCLVLMIPLYFLFGILIDKYRVTVVARFKTTWLFRAWKASSLFSIYEKFSG